MADKYSSACCTTPAAVVGDYTPKGSWTEINGFKTYVTGSASATKAIVQVYDLFGYSNQTYQGADVLATHGSEQYLVFVPDFIGPEKAAKLEWFKPGADPKPLQDLLKIVTSESMMKDIRSTAAAIKSDDRYKHVQRWAGVGFCWGSKGISLIAAEGEESLFDVTAHSSPSRLDPQEAKTATIPTMMLTSNMEDEAVAKAYFENLKGPRFFERFDEIHGWMSARGDLKQERVRKEYERGYKLILDWLGKHL